MVSLLPESSLLRSLLVLLVPVHEGLPSPVPPLLSDTLAGIMAVLSSVENGRRLPGLDWGGLVTRLLRSDVLPRVKVRFQSGDHPPLMPSLQVFVVQFALRNVEIGGVQGVVLPWAELLPTWPHLLQLAYLQGLPSLLAVCSSSQLRSLFATLQKVVCPDLSLVLPFLRSLLRSLQRESPPPELAEGLQAVILGLPQDAPKEWNTEIGEAAAQCLALCPASVQDTFLKTLESKFPHWAAILKILLVRMGTLPQSVLIPVRAWCLSLPPAALSQTTLSLMGQSLSKLPDVERRKWLIDTLSALAVGNQQSGVLLLQRVLEQWVASELHVLIPASSNLSLLPVTLPLFLKNASTDDVSFIAGICFPSNCSAKLRRTYSLLFRRINSRGKARACACFYSIVAFVAAMGVCRRRLAFGLPCRSFNSRSNSHSFYYTKNIKNLKKIIGHSC